jgi:hypothetical protein
MKRRLPDWPERLADYLARSRGAVFAWGTNDCARFAAGAVGALTGQQVAMPAWVDKNTSVAVLRACGGIVAAVDAVLPRLATPLLAWRGDVVLVQTSARRWLAVCDGERAWAPGPAGLVATPMDRAVHAWGVGRCLQP